MSALDQNANARTMPVRCGYRFDKVALDRWTRPMDERTRRGQFWTVVGRAVQRADSPNPTYKLVMPGRSYILRRKPPGDMLKGAHAADREAFIRIKRE